MGKGGKIAMIIIGAILLIIGIVMLVDYMGINTLLQTALAACEFYGEPLKTTCIQAANLAGAAGMLYLIPGIILLAVGAILLLVGLLKLKNA